MTAKLSDSARELKSGRVARVFLFASVATIAAPAFAHTSEGGFVLLLPTDLYIASGVLAVAMTVLLLVFLSDKLVAGIFRTFELWRAQVGWLSLATSLTSTAFLLWLIFIGLNGPRDPLANPLPLTVWTVWWVGLVFVQGFVGNVWQWIDPWRGAVWALRRVLGGRPIFRFPTFLGHWLGILSFGGFAGFLLADIAPSDPARLARVVALYWAVHFLGMALCGRRWSLRAEGIGMLMQLYARLSPLGKRAKHTAIGLWGWQIAKGRQVPFGLAVMSLLLLGSGSFDGVNETFWWLAQLGINPLAFPGRSAVVWQTLTGLIVANLLLLAIFVAALWLGLKLSGVRKIGLADAFCIFAPSVLPITLGYHFAHYFTSFLVEAQYAIIAATDPWARGQDLLGLGEMYVTTGFFNVQESVRFLWLCQAGGVVLGHIFAVLLSHALAVRYLGTGRVAVASQAPLALFMIGYTFFGLWLLASPRGF